jgi:hypothetical protein
VVTLQEFSVIEKELSQLESELEKARAVKRQVRERILRLKGRKQRLLQKQDEMVTREIQNVEELEVNEWMAAASGPPRAKAPAAAASLTGFSQVSFGSFGRTSLMPTGNS